ncbi:MAG: hypothetical protein JWM49_2010 [Microbacteriaceae bacterium]|nr:hypothetical protein [Microbacteriaceae bacterium]
MTAGHDDDRIVTDLLTAIEGDGDTLRPVLLELRSFANGPVPVPSPELAELMDSTVVSLATRRRTRRRAVIFSVAVVTAMGVGTTAAAAAVSPEFRATTQRVITGIVSGLTPPGDTSPVDPASTPNPSNVTVPAKSTTTHPTPHPAPTDSLAPQPSPKPNRSSHGQSDPLPSVKPVLPVPPSQGDHIPGIPPTPHKIWTNGLVPGIFDKTEHPGTP